MENYDDLLRTLAPDRTFFSFGRFDGLTQTEVLSILFACPAMVELFARIDRLGRSTKPLGYPLSIVVRWLIAMVLTREEAYSRFYERLRCDEQLTKLVLGSGDASLPRPTWLSDAIRYHRMNIMAALHAFYRELMHRFIASDPDLKYGLVTDTMNIQGYSNPPRRVMERDPDSGRFRSTDKRRPATDETAAYYAKREHLVSRRPGPQEDARTSGVSRTRYGWASSSACFVS